MVPLPQLLVPLTADDDSSSEDYYGAERHYPRRTGVVSISSLRGTPSRGGSFVEFSFLLLVI